MNNKYKLPDDVKMVVLGFVKGQNRRIKLYQEKYNAIMEEKAATEVILSNTINIHNSQTEAKVIKIEELNNNINTTILNVVQDCLNNIGNTYPLDIQQKLRKAIILNCCSKQYSYERLDLPTISRNGFYFYKNMFLYNIAYNLQLI